jgi:CPA2 family monovalent cation:H+ antiporter-2
MTLFHDILLVLGIAVLIICLLRLIKLPPILGYLIAGCLCGPAGLGLFHSIEGLSFVAEIGVVFLLFTIGLELSLPKLVAMRRSLLSLGGLQVILCSLAILSVAMLAGVDSKAAFTIAGAIALSSTAVVTKQLLEQGELYQEHGKASLSILLFQDLAAIPFLIIVPSLANESASISQILFFALLKGGMVVIILMVLGHRILRPLFHQVAMARSTELFMLAILLVVLSAAWLTETFGLSMALGGFLAGALLAETEYQHQIESDIEPFRDIFLGFFFVTVGMKLNPAILLHQGHWVLLVVLGILLIKGIIIALLARVSGLSLKFSIKTGLALAQGGEFGFALLALASTYHIIDTEINQIVIAAIIISLALAPILIRNSKAIAGVLTAMISKESALVEDIAIIEKVSDEIKQHAIICGFGRVGQHLARFLEAEGINYIGLDLDPTRIKEATAAHEPIFYGDSTQIHLLEAAGLSKARILLIAFNDHDVALKIIKTVRRAKYDLPILVRAQDDKYLEELQLAGATEVVPETLEASLMLASHMLLLLGQDPQRVNLLINDVISSRYSILKAYFKGEDEADRLESLDENAEFLHTVTITEGAFSAGKSIAEILNDCPEDFVMKITAFKRDGVKSLSPNLDVILKPGDIIILQGTNEQLYLAEAKLLKG